MAREEQRREGDKIHGDFRGGTFLGPVAAGKDIEQQQSVGEMNVQITDAELGELRDEFGDLRRRVEEAAPPEEQEKALEMVDELEGATISEQPKPVTMRYVRDWFVENLPAAAGAVTAVLVNPIVGKLVQSAGDAVMGEFKQLLGGADR